MKCLECGREVGELKKHQLHSCVCGAKLMFVQIDKVKKLLDLRRKDK